jgi:hypothetical protein
MSKPEQRILGIERQVLGVLFHSLGAARQVERQHALGLRAIYSENNVQEDLRTASVSCEKGSCSFRDLGNHRRSTIVLVVL